MLSWSAAILSKALQTASTRLATSVWGENMKQFKTEIHLSCSGASSNGGQAQISPGGVALSSSSNLYTKQGDFSCDCRILRCFKLNTTWAATLSLLEESFTVWIILTETTRGPARNGYFTIWIWMDLIQNSSGVRTSWNVNWANLSQEAWRGGVQQASLQQLWSGKAASSIFLWNTHRCLLKSFPIWICK